MRTTAAARWGFAPALAATMMAGLSGVVVAQSDPLPYGPDTCVNGFVWREARVGDTVCVTPATRSQVAQQNADPGAHKDPFGAYGPQSCAQGYVWREAFDGDTICVTPAIRAATLADNAAAASRKAANNQPAGVTLQATGAGVASTVDLYDPAAVPRRYNVGLPFTHTSANPPESGQLYQIVVVGEGAAQPGCTISVGGRVVVSDPSGQCVWVAP